MIPAREALERLRDGNRRFASGARTGDTRPTHLRPSGKAKEQEPFAIMNPIANAVGGVQMVIAGVRGVVVGP